MRVSISSGRSRGMRHFGILTSVLALTALPLVATAATAQDPLDRLPRVSMATFDQRIEDGEAITYSSRQVPVGTRARIISAPLPGNAHKVVLTLRGLRPNRDYGAHVHVNRCGRTGGQAGPHFQQVEAPEGVSGDPRYANPRNEVWLDFHTDARGNAMTTASGDWNLGPRRAESIVLHEHRTRTEPGRAGKAGDRLACMNARL